jgi:hypothetical protein
VATEDIGQESAPEAPVIDAAPEDHSQGEIAPPEQSESQGHPAWAPIREALGDPFFHKIQPHLAEFDKQAQTRITELNSRYSPWKDMDTNGVTPDTVRQAFQTLQEIQANPADFYSRLHAHLSEQGLLPELPGAAPASQSDDPDADDYVDPRDKEIAELKQKAEQALQLIQNQDAQRQQEVADQRETERVRSEISELRASAGYTPALEARVLKQAMLYAQAGIEKSLKDVAAEFGEYRTEVLQTPRPNDTAPRIPGFGGAAPTGQPQQKDPTQFSRTESVDYLAGLLAKGNG